jgi:hypothetical protein
MWSLVVASFFSACATRPQKTFASPAQSKVDLTALAPGVIEITSPANSVAINVDPPNRRIEPISEGAADATRSFLNTPNLGNPQIEAGVGAIQFALSPFAAAYGAISASQHSLSPQKISEAQQELAESIKSTAVSEALARKVQEIARQKTRRLLVFADASSNSLKKQTPVSAVLEISLVDFSIRAAKPGGNQYFLAMNAHARLLRVLDGRILLERSYQYESGPALFVDWTRYGGLEGVAQTGYRTIAEDIATDVFEPSSEPPILIGPGQKHSRLSSFETLKWISRRFYLGSRATGDRGSEEAQRLMIDKNLRDTLRVAFLQLGTERQRRHFNVLNWRGRRAAFVDADSLQFASFVQEETGSMEIHTGRTDDRIRSPAPAPDFGNGSANMSDTKWSMDGLEYDRNAVVQGVSCVVAVPMGLWEQTFGLFRKHSQEKTEKLANELRTATTQAHFEGDLADEVTHYLQGKIINSVARTDEPIRFGLSAQTNTDATGPEQSHAPAQGKTALELQVLSTQLVGKHPNSQSRSVVVEIQATIYRTEDGQEIYSCPIRYRSSEKRLKDWAAANAKLFRQELGTCSRQAAQALANDLISRGLVTPQQKPGPAFLERPGEL